MSKKQYYTEVTNDPPKQSDSKFSNWKVNGDHIRIRSWNSVWPHISGNLDSCLLLVLLSTQNIDLHETYFSLTLDDSSSNEYYVQGARYLPADLFRYSC